jgi:hypothetical protein
VVPATRVCYLRRHRNYVRASTYPSRRSGRLEAATLAGSYAVGDLSALETPLVPLAAIRAFYSLIHVTPGEVPSTLKGWSDAQGSKASKARKLPRELGRAGMRSREKDTRGLNSAW